jgi:protein SCO1/2
MPSSPLRAIAIALLAAAATAGCGGSSDGSGTGTLPVETTAAEFLGAAVVDPQVVPSFTLMDQGGALIGPQTFRGKAVLLTFLYTHCPDVCPLIASNLNNALRQLPVTERANVRILAVSVDPKGDTPRAVRKYVRQRHLVPEFRYLIGSEQRLTEVWRKYKVQAVSRSPELVDHVAYTLLVDRSGKGIVLYDSSVNAKEVLHDLRRVLAS